MQLYQGGGVFCQSLWITTGFGKFGTNLRALDQRGIKYTFILAIWLLLFKQRRMQFKSIKRRLFCWTGGQEQ